MGLVFLLIAAAMHYASRRSWLLFLIDSVRVLIFFGIRDAIISLIVAITGSAKEGTLTLLIFSAASLLFSFLMSRLLRLLKRKLSTPKKGAPNTNPAAARIPAPAAPAVPSVPRAAAPSASAQPRAQSSSASPSPVPRAAAPASAKASPAQAAPLNPLEKREHEMAALAEQIGKASPADRKDIQKDLKNAKDQTELYAMIDDEAALLPPEPDRLYTSEGQKMLLDAVGKAIPRLVTLCYPGFPGDRLVHAASGAEAYEAMQQLKESMTSLVKGMDHAELRHTMVGTSPQDALAAWKAFRFYARAFETPDIFEPVLAVLSEKV